MKNFLRSRDASKAAAALIIVLAFVVLLTGLALAYFTGTTIERQLTHSSYNDTDADLLARSALDVVVSDFKQEIANGSTATSVSGATIYVPINATNMVPQQSGNVAGVPNLIRRSVYPDSLSGNPGVPSRASAVNSQNNASANSRYVTSTRWNAHYLVPKGNTATTDSSPIPAFTAATPDWVIVTRAGPTSFASWDATLADPTNTNYAIGRYAYAVYDEGGLLEINVAGYPKEASPLPELLTDRGRKGVLAWADLTALASPFPTVNPGKIVGFRNYATTGQSNVSNFNFAYSSNTPINAFINYFLGSPIPGAQGSGGRIGTSRDFGAVRNDVVALDSRTDQSFMTRAELIRYFSTAVILPPAPSMNMLQYLGTFSREKNQPTLPLTPAWPSTWPKVVLPQRFYLGNLNCVQHPVPATCPGGDADVRTNFGLEFVNVVTSGSGPCDSQVRWKYVHDPNDPNNHTPVSAIPRFPNDLTTLDFFQYIDYALFGYAPLGVALDDSTNIPFTLGIGAALIDMYDVENTLATGIYYGSNLANPCTDDGIPACLVYGAETFSTVWSPVPTCIIPVPQVPDPYPASGGDGPPPINKGFRNVGEFGWAYNILNAANNHNSSAAPKYLIDFKDAYDPNNPDPTLRNPDPALLDFFTYNSSSGYQGAPVRSGIVNLNTRQAPVLAAILSGALFGGTSRVLNPDQATNAANAILNDPTYGTIAHPAMSRADIARFGGTVASGIFGVAASQDRRDTFARVLSELTQTRTWGLLIDVVAQTGHYKPNATGLADFVVEGEKRYWLHIAIDRFDGTIVGQQLEEVVE